MNNNPKDIIKAYNLLKESISVFGYDDSTKDNIMNFFDIVECGNGEIDVGTDQGYVRIDKDGNVVPYEDDEDDEDSSGLAVSEGVFKSLDSLPTQQDNEKFKKFVQKNTDAT